MSKKRLSKWKDSWLSRTDAAGDVLGEYVVKVDEHQSRCNWCKLVLWHGSAGVTAILQHAKSSKSHQAAADAKKGRNTGTQQRFFVGNINNNNEEGPRVPPPPAEDLDIDIDDPPLPAEDKQEAVVQPARVRRLDVFRVDSLVQAPTPNNRRLNLGDRVVSGETLLLMKGIESNSMETLPELCSKIDQNSEVFPLMKFSRHKQKYMVTDGLYPHFHGKLVRDLLRSVGFVIIIDASTFKQQGLSQHCEIKVKFWSPTNDLVQDNFLDFNSVGHETADIQLELIKSSLEKDGLSLANVLQVSRDNPNVMKSLFRKLKVEATAAGNPNLIDAPCYIHPAH